MIRAALAALAGHWRRHPVQLLTLVVGVALATGLWTGVQAINAQARLSYAEAAATIDRDGLPRLEGELGLADFARLRREGYLVTPLVERRLPGTGLRVLGLDPFTAPPGAASAALGDAETLGAFLAGEAVLAAPGTVDRLPAGLEGRPVEGIAPGVVVADVAAALRILGTDRLDALLVARPPRPDLPPLAGAVPGARLVEPTGENGVARLTDSFHLNLTAFGLLAFAVGLFIVHAAIGLAFEQRRPLFRTLRALGVPLRVLAGCLAGELVLFTLLGGGLGVVLGYAVAAALLPGVAATLSGLYGAGVGGALTLAPAWWLSGFAMAGIGLVAAGGGSLLRLARMPVLAPAMPRAWARASAATTARQAAGGAALLLAGAALAYWGDGLAAGFALLGALLLGAALLLPAALALLLALGARLARAPVAQWVWADARQQVPGLSLALMALMLALAANIGVGTMVGSFRATFTGWLDQRLAAELYVTARDADQADRIRAWLLDGRADAVLPIVSAEAALEGAPGEVFGITDDATYRLHWPLLDAAPDAWDRLAAGEGAMVNEQLARREGLWTGDRADLGRGGPREILGVYSDYGNPRPQAYLGRRAFAAAFPEVETTRFALRVDPGAAPALADALAGAFDLPGEGVLDQGSVKRFSLGVFERTFAVTGALNALTLGVAAFALWASLTTLAGMRLPQVAPLWALGLTRRRIALLDFGRALALAALTAVLAVPVGVALAWALLAVVNVLAFGWRLPLQVFPLEWAALGLWAMLAAGLAALFPALRLWRMPPAALVKVFSHER